MNWLIGKNPDRGEDWRREEKGMTEDEMVGWHHWLDGYDFSKLPDLVMDTEAWRAAVHGVTMSWTWLINWTELNLTVGHDWATELNFSHQLYMYSMHLYHA